MRDQILRQLRRSLWATSLAYVANDGIRRWRMARGDVGTGSGSTHAKLSPATSVEYISRVYNDYKTYGGVSRFYGRAAELGPGDNGGVALMLRAGGCASVDLVDRYESHRDVAQQRAIYEELARQYPLTKIWPTECDDSRFPGVHWRRGTPAETHFEQVSRSGERYDFIVSRSVLEHLYDPLGCIDAIAHSLAPAGRMIHKIDFRDHGMFDGSGNPLKFLEVPGQVYPLMTRYSGRPNRVLYHKYIERLGALTQAGAFDVDVLVTQLAGVGAIEPHVRLSEITRDQKNAAVAFVESRRRRFAREFRDVESLHLAVQGVFVTCVRR